MPIYSPHFINGLDKDKLVVLVASYMSYRDIAEQLRNMQLQEHVHFYDGLQFCTGF